MARPSSDRTNLEEFVQAEFYVRIGSLIESSQLKIESRSALKAIFAAKGNFARGESAPPRVFGGVEVTPFPGGAKEVLCISADFELA